MPGDKLLIVMENFFDVFIILYNKLILGNR